MRCLHRKAFPCLPSFCLLAPLAFLPLCGKKHKNSRFFLAKTTKIRAYSVRVAAQCAAYRVFVCSHRSHFCRFAAKSTKTRGHLGKVFSLPLRGVFGFQKYFVAARCAAYRLFVCSQCSHFCRFAAKSTKIRAYSVCFHPSKAVSRLAWRIFGVQKNFHALLGAFSTFKRTFVAPLGAFLGFESIFVASPRRFRVSKVLCRSAMRCLRLFVCSQCSHFVARQSLAYVAARCAAYRVFLRKTRAFFWQKAQKFAQFRQKAQKFALIRRDFGFRKRFQFVSDKNHHTLRRLYG